MNSIYFAIYCTFFLNSELFLGYTQIATCTEVVFIILLYFEEKEKYSLLHTHTHAHKGIYRKPV